MNWKQVVLTYVFFAIVYGAGFARGYCKGRKQ